MVTASRAKLDDAAGKIQSLVTGIHDAGANTWVHARGAFMGAARHVRSGDLVRAREVLVAVGAARHQSGTAVRQALALLDEFGPDTHTAYVA